MKLLPELFLLLYLTFLSSSTPIRRSLPFRSVIGLTRLPHDFSKQESVTKGSKFFHESVFDPHYDGRFADAVLPLQTRTFHLRLLLRSYIEAMDRIGVQTWIMHGCLLGWWWNGHIMPWDNDVDVMITPKGLQELGQWWNMTVHPFSASELGFEERDGLTGLSPPSASDGDWEEREKEGIYLRGKKYLLEVNPSSRNPSSLDSDNIIDARWVDTSTGLFIDITALRPVPANQRIMLSASKELHGYLADDLDDSPVYTKDRRIYIAGQIFPLRTSMLEDVEVKIPFAYETLLVDEYGPRALTETWFDGWSFDEVSGKWMQRELSDEEREKSKAGWQNIQGTNVLIQGHG